MAWTAPRTFVSGEVLTAAIFNVHVRDNLAMLQDPTINSYTPSVFNVATSARLGRWSRDGGWIKCDFDIVLSGAPSGTIQISLPVAAQNMFGPFASRAYVRGYCTVTAGGLTPGFVTIDSSNTLRLLTVGGTYFNAATPAGLGSGHIINGHLTYEAL